MSLSAAVFSMPSRREPRLVANSPAMQEVLAAIGDVAPAPTTVLLLGESGTGKEVVARTIHRRSPRRDGPYVAVNCAALPAELLESELFGHERGAFTGAAERRAGKVEQADKGTLLLDEISEMPLPLQAKLLRVLQEREVDRVGGHRPVPVDIRVIATSNRDLARMVTNGQFRADLYYRLNVFPIRLPALRERGADLPDLCAQLLKETADQLGIAPPLLTSAALQALLRERFPGNVRELGNLLERSLIRCRGTSIDVTHLGLKATSLAPFFVNTVSSPHSSELGLADNVAAPHTGIPGSFPVSFPLDLNSLERLAIGEALRRTQGNRTHAARILGIGLRTLRNKLRQWREEGVPLEESFDEETIVACPSSSPESRA